MGQIDCSLYPNLTIIFLLSYMFCTNCEPEFYNQNMNLLSQFCKSNQNMNLSSDFDLNEETMDLSRILLAVQLELKFLNCCSKVDFKGFFISLKFRSKHQNLKVHFSKLLSVTLRSGIEKPLESTFFFKYAQFLLGHFIILVGNMKTSETLSMSQIVLMFERPI